MFDYNKFIKEGNAIIGDGRTFKLLNYFLGINGIIYARVGYINIPGAQSAQQTYNEKGEIVNEDGTEYLERKGISFLNLHND